MTITLYISNSKLKILRNNLLENYLPGVNDNQQTDTLENQIDSDDLDDFPSGLITLY